MLHSGNKDSLRLCHSNLFCNFVPCEEIMSYFVGHGASVANAYPTGSIKGTIPTSIGFLSKLEFLRIGSQAISGTIPSEIGLLSNLELLGCKLN